MSINVTILIKRRELCNMFFKSYPTPLYTLANSILEGFYALTSSTGGFGADGG